jgi:hypothetical protein
VFETMGLLEVHPLHDGSNTVFYVVPADHVRVA